MKTPITCLFRGALCALIASSVLLVAKAEDSKNTKEKKVPPAILKKYDANKDGVLDETEKAALEADVAKSKAAAEAKRLAKYDANKDGKLDESELATEKAEKKAAADKKKAEMEKKKPATEAATTMPAS